MRWLGTHSLGVTLCLSIPLLLFIPHSFSLSLFFFPDHLLAILQHALHALPVRRCTARVDFTLSSSRAVS